jgi:REP element-mobilizing transposase RayT
MPRAPRLDIEGALQHVMARGIERRELFRNDADREDLLTRLAVLAPETGAVVYAWSLMPNHFHLLVRSGPSGLSTFMRRLQTGYAVTFNRRHQRSGHLFQNRFKSIVVEEGRYLLQLVRYIHLNPIWARLVRNLRELDVFPWSGHAVLLGRREASWQDTETVLSQFGRTRASAVRAYREFVSEGMSQGRRPELGGAGRSDGDGEQEVVASRKRGEGGMRSDARVLGSERFRVEIEEVTERQEKRRPDPRDVQPELQELLGRVCRARDVRVEDLRGPGRERHLTEVRAQLAREAVRELGIPAIAVARFLSVSSAAVSQMVIRAGKKDRGAIT